MDEEYIDDAGGADLNQENEPQEAYLSSGSSFQLSTSSNASPTSSNSDPERRPRSKKRKSRGSTPDEARSRSKCVRASYNDHYRELFNQSVSDVAGKAPSFKQLQWGTSQVGIAIWSSEEKESLFSSLERSAQLDLAAIVNAIGTKTQPEVQDFIRLLQEAKANQHLRSERELLLDSSTLPAAFEISNQCDAALEEAAGALALYQRKEDEKLERERHGRDWLLTHKIAQEIHDRFNNSDPNGEVKVAKIVPPAVLLDLKAFLDLSSRLFMNSRDRDYNWQSFAERRERPSIFFTAFSDLTNLVLGVTERLVQSAIFVALSRLRATDASKYSASRYVKRQDVQAAVEILGMGADAHDYWVNLPRRCKLDVIDERGRIRKRKIFGKRLGYDEVENLLNGSRNANGQISRSRSQSQSRATSLEDDTSSMASLCSDSVEEDVQAEPGSDEELRRSPALSDSKLTFASPRSIRAQNRFDREQLAYMSALDHRSSLEEEQRLWTLLDKAPPISIDPEAVELPRNPGPERKTREDLENWRDMIDYRAHWETNETHVPTEAFARNRATWRRRKRMVVQWEDFEVVDRSENGNVSDDIEEPEDDDLSESQSDDLESQFVGGEGIPLARAGSSSGSISVLETERDEVSSDQQGDILDDVASRVSPSSQPDGENMDRDDVLTRIRPELVLSLPLSLGDMDDEGNDPHDGESDDSSDTHAAAIMENM